MAGEKWRVWAARVAVVAAGAAVAFALTTLWRYAHRDDPSVIENPHLARVANAACAAMREESAAAAVGTSAPISQRVGAINAQNDAVTGLVSTVNRLVDPVTVEQDRPAADWLADWRRLVQARDAYAESLAAGHPKPMVLPTIDGLNLQTRLNGVGLNCRVPLVLLAP